MSSQSCQTILDEVRSIHSPSWDSLFKPRTSQGNPALATFLCRWSATLGLVPFRHPVPLHYIPRPCFTSRNLLNLRLRQPHNSFVPLDLRCRILIPSAFLPCIFPTIDSARADCATGCDVEDWRSRTWRRKPEIVKAAKGAVAKV